MMLNVKKCLDFKKALQETEKKNYKGKRELKLQNLKPILLETIYFNPQLCFLKAVAQEHCKEQAKNLMFAVQNKKYRRTIQTEKKNLK